MYKIKSLETENNKYYLSYGVVPKTSYEQQLENRKRFIAVWLQRVAGVLLIVGAYIFSKTLNDATMLIVCFFLGLILILYRESLFK